MSDYYRYPSAYPAHASQAGTPLAMGKVGAVVGVCGAGAANLHRLQKHEVSGGDAVVDTLRAGLISGLAAASATYVAGQFRSPAMSLLATVATGTAVAYALTGNGRRKPEEEGA